MTVDAESRLDRLVGDAYEIMAFRDLPEPHQCALAWWMAVDGEAWLDILDYDAVTSKFQTANWYAEMRETVLAALPRFAETYGDEPFGILSLPTEALIQSIGTDEAIAEDGGDAEAYRQGALNGAIDRPYSEHAPSDRWPVILSSHDDETVQDGWNRLGCYIRQGAESIPAVFYPAERHLCATASPRP